MPAEAYLFAQVLEALLHLRGGLDDPHERVGPGPHTQCLAARAKGTMQRGTPFAIHVRSSQPPEREEYTAGWLRIGACGGDSSIYGCAPRTAVPLRGDEWRPGTITG